MGIIALVAVGAFVAFLALGGDDEKSFTKVSGSGRTYFDRFPSSKKLDILTLASALRSEVGNQTKEEKEAVGWSIRNRAIKMDVPLSVFLWPPAKQGTKRPDNPKKRRPYATTKKASKIKHKDLFALAEKILLSPESADPVGGAYDAYEPKLSDWLHNQYLIGKRKKPHDTAKELERRRKDVWGMTKTAEIGRWVFWRKI